MKKIFTLMAATFLTVAVFAADRRPSVTVQASRHFEIQIDGKSYFTRNGNEMDINFLRDGRHTITVFRINNGFFKQKMKKVIASTTFLLRGNDIDIKVDPAGRIQVKEDTRFGYNRNDNRWEGKDDRPSQSPARSKGSQQGKRF